VRSSMSAVLFCSFLLLQTAPARVRPRQQPESKAPVSENSGASGHPILVELFTSEGCSTCPPADAFLQKLDATQPVPDAQLIVLSEHVDYWDHDGWKDPNSSTALTARQSAYVSALRLKTPYTPQIIVDGTAEIRLGDRDQEIKIFQAAVASPKIPVRIGDVIVDAGNPAVLQTHIEVDGNSDKHDADVYAAVVLDRVESQVLHGENGGQHLTHVAVVQQITKIGKLKRGQAFGENVQLKLKPGIDPKNVRIVAFVQESGPGRILGGALRRPAI
jgi:hypothetical protein